MANLNVIYRIAADISALESNVGKGVATMGRMESAALGIGKVLSGVFTVAAVEQFTRAILEDADSLTKLHDKTGISTTGLQAMRMAGDDAGVSLESMATAVNMLQKRLGGGDQSAVRALQDMNLNIETFKRLDGAQQMAAISDAVKGMHDPLRVAADLSALFGKQWAEQLPALKRGFEEVKTGAGQMSEEAVKAVDDLGDGITRLWRTTKAVLGEGLGDLFSRLRADYRSLKVLNGEGATEADALAAAQKQLTTQLRAVDASFDGLTHSEDFLNETQKALTRSTDYYAESAKKAAQAQRDFERATTISLRTYEKAASDFVIWENQMTKGLISTTIASKNLADTFTGTLSPAMDATGGNMRHMATEAEETAQRIAQHFQDALSRIPQMFIDAFTGGGGVMGALKAIGVDLLNAIVRELLDPIWKLVGEWAAGIAAKIAGAFALDKAVSVGGGVAGVEGGAAAGGGFAAGGALAGLGIIGGLVGLGLLLTPGGGIPRYEDAINPGATIQFDDSGLPIQGSMPSFAAGSGGIRDFGRGTMAMLHGREAIIPERQLAGVGGITVHINASGAFFNTPADRQRLADRVGRALQEQTYRSRSRI